MFKENMHHLIEEFETRRELLIASVGDILADVLSSIANSPLSFHGTPPYLICDAEAPLLWVDGDGRYKRLPPSFSISSDITEITDQTVLYTLPVANFGLTRFVPANSSFQPEDLDEDSSSVDGYTPEFLAGLTEYVNLLAQQIPNLASITMAKSLLTAYPLMKRKADAENIEIREFLSIKEVRDFYVSLLGEALIEGAKKAAKLANEARAKKTG